MTLLSSITVEPGALIGNTEFEYIWRWLFFKRIVADNEEYMRNLFVDNDEWKAFEKKIGQIKDPIDLRKSIIPGSIKVALPYKDPSTLAEISPEMEIDLSNIKGKEYHSFIGLIDEAEKLFSQTTKTDIPYFIFVDELEAYYGEKQTFERDLALIRDLVFTVKRFNTIFAKSGMKKTKVICSVRSEILNAISRFVVTKEMNKVTSGFSVPLQWTYTNTSSYQHPIIQILLKRMAVCESKEKSDHKEIYGRWFPEKIHKIEPANYILNNSWCKPRDMVRLLSTAQNSLQNNSTAFTQSVFDALNKSYSEESLSEIKEELRALYDPEAIDTIINCFMGYKTVFSVAQLKERVSEYFSGTILETCFVQIIEDLYRLGFLGNFMPASKMYRWQHKGDDRAILAPTWRLCVHFALHSALSIGAKLNYSLNRGSTPEAGDTVIAVVKKVIQSFALVEFSYGGLTYMGSIHIGEFSKAQKRYIEKLSDIIHVGEEFNVVVGEYNEKHKQWRLQLIDNIVKE